MNHKLKKTINMVGRKQRFAASNVEGRGRRSAFAGAWMREPTATPAAAMKHEAVPTEAPGTSTFEAANPPRSAKPN